MMQKIPLNLLQVFKARDKNQKGGLLTKQVMGVVVVISFTALSIIACTISPGNERRNGDERDDTQEYLIDFAGFFGPDWVAGTIRQEKEGANIATTDIFGRDRTIVGRAYYSTHNQANSLAYFRQYVFLFTTEAEANEHFDEEREWIFVYAYGTPISRQEHPFRDLELPPEISFQADEYQVACSETPIVNRCNGLLRYKEYIIFVDAIIVRDSVQYLTESDLLAAIDLIDEKMNLRENPTNSQ